MFKKINHSNSMVISTNKIAYKMGFSAGLCRETISAYLEMQKYKFGSGDDFILSGLKRSFSRGYKEGIEAASEARYELQLKQITYPDIQQHFNYA